MTTTHFSQSTNGAPLVTAIPGTSLNALANGAYALGPAINNTPGGLDSTISSNGFSYDLYDITITLSSPVTAGDVTPSISIYFLPTVDGVNYPTPPGATAGPAPSNYLVGTYQGVASASTETMSVLDLSAPQYDFKVLILNNLGVAFPSTNTNTCQIQARCVAAG
jgi:hypothetical protein